MWRGYNIYSKYKVINIFCKAHFCTHSAAGAGGDALKTQPGKTKSIHIIYLDTMRCTKLLFLKSLNLFINHTVL